MSSFECLAPNLSVGNLAYVPLGVSATTNNRGGIAFYYAGSGSANNYMSFGSFFGATGILAAFPNGGVAIAASGTPTTPGAGCLSVSGTTASVALALAGPQTVMVSSPAANAVAFIEFGTSAVAAVSTTGTPILPGTARVFSVPGNATHVAAI